MIVNDNLLLFLLLGLVLVGGSLAGTSPQKLMWSVQPLSHVKISSIDTWEDIPDTNLTLTLLNEAPLLISYDFAARAFKPGSSTNDFILDEDMSLGQKDFLQARVLVDGIPFRQSSSNAQPSSSLEAASRILRGTVVVNLGAGPHTVQLQWKKRGTFVTSWNNIPALHDGYSSGRILTATAHHRYMWHTEVSSDDVISVNGTWVDMKDSFLTFTLVESASLRFLYSMSVKPDYVNPRDEFGLQDDLSARLVVDGYPYRETGSFTTISSHSYASAQLSRDIVLDLQAGVHTVKLQWRKWGNYVRVWRSAPSFLDGYASSRILAVHGER